MNTLLHKTLCFLLLSVCGLQAQSLINLTFQNQTSRDIDVIFKTQKGTFRKYETLRPGGRYVQQSYVGQRWALADSTTQKIFKSVTAGNRSQTVVATRADFQGGGPSVGHDHSPEPPKSELRLIVKNQTDHVLRVYQNDHGKREYVTSIPVRKNATIEAFPNEAFVIEDEEENQVLKNVSIRNQSETLVITERDYHRQDKPAVPIYLSIYNRTPRTLTLLRNRDGRSERHSSIPGNQSTTVKSLPGEVWSVEEPRRGRIVKTITTGTQSNTIEIRREDIHRGIPPRAATFECAIVNQTPHRLIIYRNDKAITKLDGWKTYKGTTRNGETWRIQDEYSKANLRQFAAEVNSPSLTISQSTYPTVTTQITNRTPSLIQIYEVGPGGTEVYKKRINAGRYYRLKTNSGQHILAKDAATQRVIQSFYAPALDGEVYINEGNRTSSGNSGHSHGSGGHSHGSGHSHRPGDHSHGSGTRPHHDHDHGQHAPSPTQREYESPREREVAPLSPGDLWRKLFQR